MEKNVLNESASLMKKIRLFLRSDYIISILSTVIHAGLIFVYGVFVKHYVLPDEYGLYVTANIVLTYMNYLQLGVLNSYNRDYPQAVGGVDHDRMSKLQNTTFTYLMFTYIITGLVISAVVQILASKHIMAVGVSNGICLLCVVAVLSNITSIFSTKYRSHGMFYKASIIQIISTTAQVLIGGMIVFFIGYYGIYCALLLSSISSLFFMRKDVRSVKISIDRVLLLDMIKTGIPLLINGFIWTIIATSDQFIILFFSTRESLGLYSVAQTVFSVTMLLPQTISQVMYVKLSNSYGKTGDKKELFQLTKKCSTIITILNSCMFAFVYTILPVFVNFFMPAYNSSVLAAQIMCVGVTIYGGTMVYGNLFSILKKNMRLLIATSCLCVANLLFSCLLVVALEFDLKYVAFGTAISYFVYSIILLANTSKMFEAPFIPLVIREIIPIVAIICPIIILNLFITGIAGKVIICFVCALSMLLASLFYFKRGKKCL